MVTQSTTQVGRRSRREPDGRKKGSRRKASRGADDQKEVVGKKARVQRESATYGTGGELEDRVRKKRKQGDIGETC